MRPHPRKYFSGYATESCAVPLKHPRALKLSNPTPNRPINQFKKKKKTVSLLPVGFSFNSTVFFFFLSKRLMQIKIEILRYSTLICYTP